MRFSMLTRKFIIYALFGCIQLSASVTNYEKCVTPKNETSWCIELTECSSLDTLAQKIVQTSEELIFLAKSQCAYKDNTVHVCCPPEETNVELENSLLPQAPKCGATGGYEGENVTAIDEFPWSALIEYTMPNGYEKLFFSGGTLINNRYVLTTATALLEVPPSVRLTSIRLGEWNLSTNPDCEDSHDGTYCAPSHTDVGVEERIPHPEYNTNTRENDIALIRLSQTVKLNEFVKPICLPIDQSLREASYVGREVRIAGWGLSEDAKFSTKYKRTVKIWDLERCKQKYGHRFRIQSKQMCAGGETGINAYPDELGGPLMSKEIIKNKPIYYLVGIKSLMKNDFPSIYTRIANYTDWIINTIKP